MPENTVKVCRPSGWGNHARVGFCDPGFGWIKNNSDAVEAFRLFMERNPLIIDEAKTELRGKNLACWCRLDEPCHADVLLEMANAELTRGRATTGDSNEG
jgi:hypothetical protein